MNFQDKGSFQVTFKSNEFYTISGSGANQLFFNQFASRPVKLGGRYKISLSGFFITSEGVTTNAFEAYEMMKKPWAFLISSQQFSAPLTPECPGPVVHLSEQALLAQSSAAKYMRLAFQGGNPLDNLSFNAYFQDRIDINISAGYSVTNGVFNFNNTLGQVFSYNNAGTYQDEFVATITLTFKYESIQGLF